jgi:chromate transport protein ChrA
MAVGALIGYIAIFAPGYIICTGFQALWRQLRRKVWLKSVLRGVHASAVGLVFAAVYRLWQIGLLDAEYRSGRPLGSDPWWVAIVATAFVGGRWFKFDAFLTILLGGTLGLIWYGVVRA